jgi:cytochrome d ubiquinol oxidase subunit II
LTLEGIAAFVLLLALSTYVLTGGADFGAGFWELVFRGEKNRKQNQLISTALAPIWEANHVWLIFAIILISAAFPKALAVLSVALDTPLLLMLIGITLRGSAFAFRHYGPSNERFQSRWGLVFSGASALTPFFLGITMGAAVSGSIRVSSTDVVLDPSLRTWLGPFPLAVGLYTFSIGAFLSAVYLAAEAKDQQFKETFRKLAIKSSVFLGIVAWTVLILARLEAPIVFERLTAHVWSWPFHVITATFSIAALVLLIKNLIQWARVAAVLQVLAIMMGLGLAQYPYVIAPDLTIFNAAAPDSSLRIFLFVTAIGLLLVTPAFAYLYWVFQFKPFVKRVS